MLKLNVYNVHNIDPSAKDYALIINDRETAERVAEKDVSSKSSAEKPSRDQQSDQTMSTVEQ